MQSFNSFKNNLYSYETFKKSFILDVCFLSLKEIQLIIIIIYTMHLRFLLSVVN